VLCRFRADKGGIRTGRGDLNREIEVTNQKLRQLKAHVSKLQDWLKEESENTEPPLHSRHTVTQGTGGKIGIFPIAV